MEINSRDVLSKKYLGDMGTVFDDTFWELTVKTGEIEGVVQTEDIVVTNHEMRSIFKVDTQLEIEVLKEQEGYESALACVKAELAKRGYTEYTIHLTGSRLYGFNVNQSDWDFIVFVQPRLDELVRGTSISKEIAIKGNSYTSQFTLYGVDKLWGQHGMVIKPNLSSLCLLDSNSGMDKELQKIVVESLNLNKRNLVLSIIGMCKGRLKKDKNKLTNKDMAHLHYWVNMVGFLLDNDITMNLFNEDKVRGFAEKAKGIRSSLLPMDTALAIYYLRVLNELQSLALDMATCDKVSRAGLDEQLMDIAQEQLVQYVSKVGGTL